MAICTRRAPFYGFVLILGLGVCIFLLPSASGQSSGKPLASLRFLVTSNVGRGCGGGILPSAIREAAVARLAYVGITMSNIHNARLSLELECMAIAPIRNKTIAVQECLTFSEFVSTPSNEVRPMFTSTWRRCRSYTCDRKCETAPEHYEARLMGDFLGDLWKRRPDSTSLQRAAPFLGHTF
jgi:hypothetical protein